MYKLLFIIAPIKDHLTEVTEFNVTPNSAYNITDYPEWHGKSYKVGNRVDLNVCLKIPGALQGSIIATIPEGFRPRTNQAVAVGGGTEKAVVVHSSSDGAWAGTISGYIGAGNLAINISYLV